MKTEPLNTEIVMGRAPTAGDANKFGKVLKYFPRQDEWYPTMCYDVKDGDVWMPSPLLPSQLRHSPDISLKASISRMRASVNNIGEEHVLDCVCNYCDTKRLIEAANKWAEQQAQRARSLEGVWKNGDVLFRDKSTGEWRQATPDDMVQDGGSIIHVASDAVPSNDPDGVGEGWRRLKRSESPQLGDQCKRQGEPNDKFEPSLAAERGRPQHYEYEYRRRINKETP